MSYMYSRKRIPYTRYKLYSLKTSVNGDIIFNNKYRYVYMIYKMFLLID